VILVLSGLLGCGDASDPSVDAQDGPADEVADQAERPAQTFYDYRLIESSGGIKQWVLDSDVMHRYKSRTDVDLVRVAMDFFKDGAYHATLLADSGVANTSTNDVHVWGNVAINTHDARRLRTSELFYSSKDGLIRNEVYNVFDRGLDVVTGYGLEATPDLDYLVIKRQVAGIVGDEAPDDSLQAGGTP
jgi:LPS export ABC transporter protein LptC